MKNKKDKIKAMILSPNKYESENARKLLLKNNKQLGKARKVIKHSHENALEPTEVKELINYVYSYDSSKRLHHLALIYLMVKAGLRVSEALQFRRDWFIKKDDCYIIVIPQGDKDITNLKKIWRPKTPSGAREIPIYESSISSFLDVYLESNKRIQLNRQNAYKMVKKYGKMINKQDLHPHALRSTYANYLVSKNVTVSTLKYLMGWAKLETANNYITGSPHAAREDFKQKVLEE